MICDSFISPIRPGRFGPAQLTAAERIGRAWSVVLRGPAGRLIGRLGLVACCLLGPACHLLIPLEVEESYFCDLFEEGACQDRRGDEHVYQVDVPAYKQDSWYDLGYHMYFHTRETPGLRLVFNRALSTGEVERLEQSMHCSYEIEQGDHVFAGHLEGVRVDAEGVWCFDYLGTMLVRLQKDRGDENLRPTPDFFPVRLRLKYESADPRLSGVREGQVIVRWSPGSNSAEKKGFN